ncbi:MAG: hypothetical protein U0516_02470 [Candidatus Saccharibacteria bacterium]
MNKLEKDYLDKVRKVISQNSDAVATVDALATITKPDTKGLSLNTVTAINFINELDFEREDGSLDVGSDIDDYDATEEQIASEILHKVKQILSDIDKENWYKYRWFVKLVYSCLKGNDYTYKIIVKTIGKKTEQEATKEMDRLKKDASHTHPEASDYTLEDVRLSAELVDSHNNLLRW